MKRATGNSERVRGVYTLATAVMAVIAFGSTAHAQNSPGSDRIDQAVTAPNTGQPAPAPEQQANSLAPLSEPNIYNADAVNGGLTAPVQTGAEQFNIPSEVMYSWSGAYVGVRAGAVLSNGNSAFSGALEAGYDFQPTARIVTGIEADIALRGDTSSLTDMPALGTVTGRLGFLPIERVLLYGEAGGALASVRGANAAGGTDTQVTPGYTLGAGAEFALDEQLTFVGEYTYTDLQDRTVPTGTDTLRSNSFEAGIKLRF